MWFYVAGLLAGLIAVGYLLLADRRHTKSVRQADRAVRVAYLLNQGQVDQFSYVDSVPHNEPLRLDS